MIGTSVRDPTAGSHLRIRLLQRDFEDHERKDHSIHSMPGELRSW